MDDSVVLPLVEVVYQLRHVGPPSTIGNSASLIRLQDDGEVTVGRGPAADYFVDSAITLRLISRIHATIKGERVPGGHPKFTIISSGLNGTYINERKMGSYPDNQQVLLEGDKITFGHPGCSSIQPGDYAPQLESEFQFIFECVPASRIPQSDRYRNISRSLPLIGNPRHSHLQKHSPVFKASNTAPRLSDSPLSNASTSEKENEVSSSVRHDVKTILPNGVDSKPRKAIKHGQNTDSVFSLENNKKVNGVCVSDGLPDPLLPTQMDASNPKLCFYNTNGDLTFCSPSHFLSYPDLVRSLKSLTSHPDEHLDTDDGGSAVLSSSHVLSDTQLDLPSYPDTFPPADLIDSCDKFGEGVTGEVNSTVIVLGDEVDDDDDDFVEDGDDVVVVEDGDDVVVVDDDDVVVEDGDDVVKDGDDVFVEDGDDKGRSSNPGCDGSAVESISDSGPGQIIFQSEAEQCNDVANVEDVVMNVASTDFPDNVVNFGIEDIVEVTVTTENDIDEGVGAIDSVNDGVYVNDNRDNDTDDDSDSSMPSLKSIKSNVQLGDTDTHDSEDGMPSLMLMNGAKPHSTEINKPITGLSYNGDISISSGSLLAKQRETAVMTNKAKSSSTKRSSSVRRSSGSASSQSSSSVSSDLIISQLKHVDVKSTSVICTCGKSKNTEKSKSDSRTSKRHSEGKCPKHNIPTKSSRVDCDISRIGVSDPCDIKKSFSEHKSKRGKSKTVVEDVLCKKSKSSKKYKENCDDKSISLDCVKESRKKNVHLTDLAAVREAALKLKSFCSEVVSKSPLSSSSKSPPSQVFQSKSPPSCLLQSMTPSSKSPLSDLYQSESPLYLHQSKSPPYISPVKLHGSKSPNLLPSKEQLFTSQICSASNSASLARAAAPVTNTTTIILSSGNEHKAKSSRSHEKSKSKKHKDTLHKQSSVSSSTTRPSSSSSSHSASSGASVSHSRSSSSGTSKTSVSNSRSSSPGTSKTTSPDVSLSKSRFSSGESPADSKSSTSPSLSRPPSGSLPDSRTSSRSSSRSELPSRSSSQNSRHSSGTATKTFFKDTVPNLYSSSDEDGTVQENKTEIVKKIYSPKGKQEDAAAKGNVPRQSSSIKAHKQGCPPLTTSSKSTAATPKQVSPPHESKKAQSRAIRDLSPASTASSNISDVSEMDKKSKTEKGLKCEKRPEIKTVDLPKVAAKPKPVAVSQTVMQLSTIKPRTSVSKQAVPSSASMSLTSLPWMTDASTPTDSYRKSTSKKTTSNNPSLNQRKTPLAVSNNKSTASVPRISGHDTSVKGSSFSHVSPTYASKTSKGLSSISAPKVKTVKKPLSDSSGQSQPKTASVREKVDSSTKLRSAKTDPASAVSKDKDLTSTMGKTNNPGKETYSKGSRSKDKPDNTKTDLASKRGKRTRANQSSSRLNRDSESSDTDDEPASKKRDLRTDAARASSQSISLRTPRSMRSDKPGEQTAATRKRKLSPSDSLTFKTSKPKGKNSKQASAPKKGKPSKNARKKKKRISDSSSEDDDENKDDDDEEDDYDIRDLLDSDSDDSESWDLPEGVQYYDNLCSARKCRNPEGKQVDWVMCDDCEQWYHVVCVNCPMDVVLKEDAQFHCGC